MSKKTHSLCVILDANPRFYVEFVLWTICVNRFLPSESFRPIVYAMEAVPTDLVEWAAGRGMEVKCGRRVIDGSPHSNKILPFFDKHDTDFTIVCDTDLFFVDDPSELLRVERFRAAPNNHCNPPVAVFRNVLAASGLNRPYRPGMALFKGSDGCRETHVNNVSAGIVVAPRSKCANLASNWRKWAQWLVDNRQLLAAWAVHVDQVAFALALEDMGEDVDFLPPQLNSILHLLDEISSCYAVHLTTGHIPYFAERFHGDRTLSLQGLAPGVADGVDRLNACIRDAEQVIHELPSTRDHWDKFLNPSWRR